MQQQLHDSQELNNTLTRSLQLNSPLRRGTIESNTNSDRSLDGVPDSSMTARVGSSFNDDVDVPDSNSLALSLFDLSTTDANTDTGSTEHSTFALFDASTTHNNRENLRLPPSGSKLSRSGILGRSKHNNHNNNQHVKNLYMQYLSETERIEDVPPLPLDAPPSEETIVGKEEQNEIHNYTGASSSGSGSSKSSSGQKTQSNSYSKSTRKADKRIDLLGSISSSSHSTNQRSNNNIIKTVNTVIDNNLLDELDGDPLDSYNIADTEISKNTVYPAEQAMLHPAVVNVPMKQDYHDESIEARIERSTELDNAENTIVANDVDPQSARVDLLGSLDDTSNNTTSLDIDLFHSAPSTNATAPLILETVEEVENVIPTADSNTNTTNSGDIMDSADIQIVLDIDIGKGQKAEVIITSASDPVVRSVVHLFLFIYVVAYLCPHLTTLHCNRLCIFVFIVCFYVFFYRS